MTPHSLHRQGRENGVLGNQQGIALITVMLLMITMTILGIAALTITGMEGRMAGFGRSGEASATAAESCLNTSVQIIQQTLDVGSGGTMPVAFLDGSPNPGPDYGPVPAANFATLNQELLGQVTNNPDTPAASPNLIANINNYTVGGDIDRLYVQPKTGTSQAFDEPAAGSTEIIYRIDCVSSNVATGTSSRITGVYACTFTSEGCQKQL